MKRYYLLADITKDYTNEKHALYFKQDTGADLVGFIYNFAKANKTNMADTRLYEFKTKTDFDKSFNTWLKAVKGENI